MRRRRTFRCPLLPALLVLLSALASPAAAQLDPGGIYRNRKLGFKLAVPEEWSWSRQTGYPALLLRLSWSLPDTGIILSSGKLRRGESLEAFVGRNNAALGEVKVRLLAKRALKLRDHPAFRVAAESNDGKVKLRQVYVGRGDTVVILTLRTSKSGLAAAEAEFSRLLDGFRFE